MNYLDDFVCELQSDEFIPDEYEYEYYWDEMEADS